ncbi:MAG: ribokinase [Anaerolineales bacterium]|nr:ribokinase [Anaerolineales bacterium]
MLVFGSINMDLAAYVPVLPRAGETLIGDNFRTVPGGKGANQAVACARLGARVEMFGRVGDDGFGREHLAVLSSEGVGIAGIAIDRSAKTGVAIIEVDRHGENTIVVISGANMEIGEEDVDRCAAALHRASALLLQLEVPLDANLEIAKLAQARGVPVILDPAPARELPEEIFSLVDILTPNEVEAESLVGFAVNGRETAEQAAALLRQQGVGRVVIKMAHRGAYYAGENEAGWVKPFDVKAVDTVAAGDAFNGGVAAAIAEGTGFKEALRWGAAAGALTVMRRGAIDSLPTRADLDLLLSQ